MHRLLVMCDAAVGIASSGTVQRFELMHGDVRGCSTLVVTVDRPLAAKNSVQN